jgi:hypothetical protein
MTPQPTDPKGLIREAYRIEGIDDPQCRSILIDWALSLAPETDQIAAMQHLLRQYGSTAPGHPMTALLHEGLQGPASGGRAKARRRPRPRSA